MNKKISNYLKTDGYDYVADAAEVTSSKLRIHFDSITHFKQLTDEENHHTRIYTVDGHIFHVVMRTEDVESLIESRLNEINRSRH